MTTQYKPVACKGCGKPILFERLQDGKWLVSEFDVDAGEKLDRHNCPNYQAKPKTFEKVVGGVVTDTWTGTNKQGQMFEAKVSQGLQQSQSSNQELILKVLTDISRKLDEQNKNIFKLFDNQLVQGQNVLEILGLLQDQFIKKQHDEPTEEEPKTATESQTIEKKQEDDYSF